LDSRRHAAQKRRNHLNKESDISGQNLAHGHFQKKMAVGRAFSCCFFLENVTLLKKTQFDHPHRFFFFLYFWQMLREILVLVCGSLDWCSFILCREKHSMQKCFKWGIVAGRKMVERKRRKETLSVSMVAIVSLSPIFTQRLIRDHTRFRWPLGWRAACP
jgi:hypothetical protein